MELEIPTERSETPSSQIVSRTPSPPSAKKHKQDVVRKNSFSIMPGRSEIEIELDKLSEDDSAEEISEWEFDDLDKDRHTRSWIKKILTTDIVKRMKLKRQHCAVSWEGCDFGLLQYSDNWLLRSTDVHETALVHS